ncbi:hypothetical protein L2E82_31222 [Cichorium intybus]|uniref:Uncharacterized protein n=1 Tax=Cichorium intybus TaxID=13427 RepID=A0ACB9D2F5_CICIN|nr:hypothetical protein L2E82_31222 [Cichorium intybus]
MLRKTFQFSEMDEGIDTLAIDVFSSVENIIKHLSGDKSKLEKFLMAANDLTDKFISGASHNQETNKSDELDVLLSVNSTVEIEVENPTDIRNKSKGVQV